MSTQVNTTTAAKDALLAEVNKIVTGLTPDVAESVKEQLGDKFKRMFSSYIEALKKNGKSTTADVLAEGEKMLANAKKEIGDMLEDIKKNNMTATQAANKAVNDFVATMKLDPKFTNIIVNIVEIKEQLEHDVKDAKAAADDLKAQLAKKTKDNHAITIDALKLILAILTLVGGLVSSMMYIVILIWG